MIFLDYMEKPPICRAHASATPVSRVASFSNVPAASHASGPVPRAYIFINALLVSSSALNSTL